MTFVTSPVGVEINCFLLLKGELTWTSTAFNRRKADSSSGPRLEVHLKHGHFSSKIIHGIVKHSLHVPYSVGF